MPRSLFVLSLAMLLSISARADYHYASHTGTSTYPYTSWGTAADSIQKAIDAATAGDTIYVGSGLWDDVPLYLADSLALIGMGIDSTTVHKGEHTGFMHFIDAYNHTLIQGITFDGNNIQYTHDAIHGRLGKIDISITNNRFINLYGGVLMARNTGRIVNNIFTDCMEGIDGTFEACSLLVKNNTFRGMRWDAIGSYNGSWTIVNNLFSFNPADDAVFGASMFGPRDTAYVANNLLYENQDWRSSVAIGITERVTCENNTIVGPSHIVGQRGISMGDTLGTWNNSLSGLYAAFTLYDYYFRGRVSYSNLWNNVREYTGNGQLEYGPGIIRSDPMFVDPDSGNFFLQAYSPLIDAGDPNILDVDGTRSDIGFAGGPHGFFYPYQDLSPRIPDSLSYTFIPDTIYITWRQNNEADFFTYKIHRDTISGFTPSAFNLIAETNISSFMDLDIDQAHNYFYKIASEDYQRNVSEPSSELAVYLTAVYNPFDPNLPRMTEISRNYPNPFNSQTIINYYLSDVGYQPAEVQLNIYDISGKLVKKLVDTRQYPGTHKAIWDGRGEGGENLSSGIYLVRLIVSGIELQKARKIMLLK